MPQIRSPSEQNRLPPEARVLLAQAPELVLVDARGLRCPLPVLRLGKIVRDMPAQQHFLLLATDPAAETDIPAYCAEKGWQALRHPAGEVLVFAIHI